MQEIEAFFDEFVYSNFLHEMQYPIIAELNLNLKLQSPNQFFPILIPRIASMRLATLILFIFLFSCESGVVQKDNMQIAAKDQIRKQLPANAKEFDITGFSEDTLSNWTDTLIKKPIQYNLEFEYRDSSGLQKKTGHVIFTPDGKSVLHSELMDRNQ
jgi:hypothetical protein